MENLGSKISAIAQPIAKTIDKVSSTIGYPTNLEHCSGCQKMKENLDQGMSFSQAIAERFFSMKEKVKTGELNNMQYIVTKTITAVSQFAIEAAGPDEAKALVKSNDPLGELVSTSDDERWNVMPKPQPSVLKPQSSARLAQKIPNLAQKQA